MDTLNILNNGKQSAMNILNNGKQTVDKTPENKPTATFDESLNGGSTSVGNIQSATKSNASAPVSGGKFKGFIKQ